MSVTASRRDLPVPVGTGGIRSGAEGRAGQGGRGGTSARYNNVDVDHAEGYTTV